MYEAALYSYNVKHDSYSVYSVCLLTNNITMIKFSGGPGLHTLCVSFFVWTMVLIQAEL